MQLLYSPPSTRHLPLIHLQSPICSQRLLSPIVSSVLADLLSCVAVDLTATLRRRRSPPPASPIADLQSLAMDPTEINVCETFKKTCKPKIVWDNDTLMKFIDACFVELRKGNRPGAHFNKLGWENLEEKNMLEKTGKIFDKKQLKNKWDNMKKDWKLYDRLMRLESGTGGTRNLLDVSPEWWDEKIKMDKEFAKFRDANLTIYESHYAPLFRDFVVVGDHVVSPLAFQNNTTLIDVDIEGQGDSDEVDVG